jgi:hypothetical protein
MKYDLRSRGVSVAAAANVMVSATFAATSVGWPETIELLTRERTQAEVCAGLLKSRGDQAAIAAGEINYEMGRAAMDGVIAGLMTSLAEGAKPNSLSTIETDLQSSGKTLREICNVAIVTTSTDVGEKGVFSEIAKSAVEPLIHAISSGVAAVWAQHLESNERKFTTITTRLEAAKWPRFGDIKPVR